MDEQSKEEKSGVKDYYIKAKHRFLQGSSFVRKHSLVFTLLLVLLLQVLPNPGGTYPWGGLWIRQQSENLLFANQVATSTLDNFVRQQAGQVVAQQYPNLPDANRQKLVDDVTKKIFTEKKGELASQHGTLAQEVRDHFQYDEGGKKYTYMPDIDPYYYLRFARNLIEKGHVYDALKNGKQWDNHMSAPFGTGVEETWHPYVLVGIYELMSIFNPQIPLMQGAAYYGLVLMFISTVLIFFLTRRIAGNLAGFFAALLLSLLPSILGRTPWGHADTDAYNIFFPTLAFFLIIEAVFADNFKKRVLFAGLTGASIGIYIKFWSGWWYVLDFIIGALVIALVFELVHNTRKWSNNNILDFLLRIVLLAPIAILRDLVTDTRNFVGRIKTDKHIQKYGIIVTILLVSSGIVSVIVGGFNNFIVGLTRGAITFTAIKNASLPTLWPNVFTTVAELNASSLGEVVNSAGGLLVFFISMLGALLLLFKGRKEHAFEFPYDLIWPVLLILLTIGVVNAWYAFIVVLCLLIGLLVIYKKYHQRDHDILLGVLLALWFIGTTYAGIKGQRFGMLIGPAVSVAFGAAAGILYTVLAPFAQAHLKIKKMLTGILIIILFGIFIIGPTSSGPHMVRAAYSMTSQDLPIVNDAWYNVLTKIKQESKSDAIINSWWDFGHHFKYFADRQVTFDGASQNAPQAHWIGRVLQTPDEKEAVAILRMLDCGGNSAFDVVYNKTQDPIVSINMVKEIIMLDNAEAKKYAQDRGVPEITQYTHCAPPENFFITSADMSSKSQVWSHFGLWDFKRAEVWLRWRFVDQETAVPQMMERFNWSREAAEKSYQDAQDIMAGINPDSRTEGDPETLANQWISPWIAYINNPEPCQSTKDLIKCGSVLVNLSSKEAQVPVQGGYGLAGVLVSYDREGNITRTKLNGNEQLTVVTWPQGNTIMGIGQLQYLSESMFTRLFYMNGLGLTHFDHFAEDNQLFYGKVSVWKVNWAGGEKRIPADVAPKTNITSGANVKLNYIGWLDNGTVFDSSILSWQENNVTQFTSFTGAQTNLLAITFGGSGLIPGFEKRIEGMKKGDERTITIPPEEAYGTDPSKHPLGNKTLHFKVHVESIE